MRVLSSSLGLMLWLAASPAAAFWCHGDLVLEGDRAYEVRARCGEPASIVATTEEITSFAGGTGRRGRYGAFGGTSVTRTIAVETWIYDFGPTRFMEELRFENGILVRMTRLSYGTPRHGSIAPPTRTRLGERGLPARARALSEEL